MLTTLSSDLKDGPFWIVFQMEAAVAVPALPERHVDM